MTKNEENTCSTCLKTNFQLILGSRKSHFWWPRNNPASILVSDRIFSSINYIFLFPYIHYSASTTTINNKTPIANMHPNTIQASPKNRSSSSQQLPIVNSKARSLYAKQGSANLLLQNSSSSGIPSPNSKLLANKSAVSVFR